LSTYHGHPGSDSADHEGQSYFSSSDRNVVTSEPELIPQSPSEAAAGAQSGADILRRMSLVAMGRRESLSEIRAANPDLSLSGNIISATFNIPHAFKYRKGTDWVSAFCCVPRSQHHGSALSLLPDVHEFATR
jgi:trehalose 6-phosphate synthase/phosphatase